LLTSVSIRSSVPIISLNMALYGDYAQQDHSEKVAKLEQIENIWDRFLATQDHILNIDLHIPFDDPCIQDVISFIDPQYVVFALWVILREFKKEFSY
jgi:hypothetical protein